MSLYDAAKDAVKIAQKIDNVELVQKLLDVQQQALDMQEKQQVLNKEINRLEAENSDLKRFKKLIFEPDHDWMIDEDSPEIKLCPVCANRDNFRNPLNLGIYRDKPGGACLTCRNGRIYR